MKKSKSAIWLALLSSGLVVAIFTFAADKVWQVYQHHPVGPRYVEMSLRREDNQLFVFVRNNSDEPLDLVRAQIDIDDPALAKTSVLGAYPDVSKVYNASISRGSASVAVAEKGLVVKVSVTQAIEPKAADHFGVALSGLAGPLDLSKVALHVELEDIKGNRYTAVQ